jgi:hypothetical protein
MKREAPDNAPAGCHFGDFELSAGGSFEPPVFMKNLRPVAYSSLAFHTALGFHADI